MFVMELDAAIESIVQKVYKNVPNAIDNVDDVQGVLVPFGKLILMSIII